MNKLTDGLVTEAVKILNSDPAVRFAYLFGSMVTGKSRPDSDCDIAVHFSPDLDKFARFDLRLHLIDRLSVGLGVDVDLVDLATAPLSLQHQILRHKLILVEKDRVERIRFEVASRRAYFDLKPYLDRRAQSILRKLGGN